METSAKCVFDYSLDQRRKIAARRREEDLNSQTLLVEGLFEMIRSSDESNVQELLAMIRANASIGSIAATVEASTKGRPGSQKRKRSVSPLASSKEGASVAERNRTDEHVEGYHVYPYTGSVESDVAASRSASLPGPPTVTSSRESLDVTGFAPASDSQSSPIIDVAQVSALAPSLCTRCSLISILVTSLQSHTKRLSS